MFNKPLLALSITAAITSTAFAQEEFRQHEAHVHGHVELNIAQDGHELLMEITAPGADVVGFEHAPHNDEQKAQLAKAIETLNNADSVFTLASAAHCHQEQAYVTHTLGEHDHDEHHDHDDHAEHDHDEHHDHDHDHDDHAEHDHDDHAEHDHDKHHDHEHEEGSQHGSFTAQYTFHCDDISKLNSIDTSWFTHFPSTKEIDVNLLTDKRQTALELNPGKTKISL